MKSADAAKWGRAGSTGAGGDTRQEAGGRLATDGDSSGEEIDIFQLRGNPALVSASNFGKPGRKRLDRQQRCTENQGPISGMSSVKFHSPLPQCQWSFRKHWATLSPRDKEVNEPRPLNLFF